MKPLNAMTIIPREKQTKELKATRGCEIKWKTPEGHTVRLETFNQKEPTLLSVTVCITIRPTFDYSLSQYAWNRQWSNIRKKLTKEFNETVSSDEIIYRLDYPTGQLGVKGSKKIISCKTTKKTYIVSHITFNNDHMETWKKDYKQSINEFIKKYFLILEEISGFDLASEEN